MPVPDAWSQAVDDVVAFTCSRPEDYNPDPKEVRQALEEVLSAAQETFDALGHFCKESKCRCRPHTLISMRAFVEARVLGIESIDAQIYAMERLSEYLDGRKFFEPSVACESQAIQDSRDGRPRYHKTLEGLATMKQHLQAIGRQLLIGLGQVATRAVAAGAKSAVKDIDHAAEVVRKRASEARRRIDQIVGDGWEDDDG
jgi:hypothetical protein